MARINDLLRQLRSTNEALARDLEGEVRALAARRAFGLNFERHVPELVELPGRKVQRGDKVRVLPPRGTPQDRSESRIWRVTLIEREPHGAWASLQALASHDSQRVAVDDLVVVAEFRDAIYPGLTSTDRLERGGTRPFHTVINGENFHALQALLFTHRARVDCIYIDPPYNTGARDWRYNNNYVEREDLYRHSKWLAFMERRLLLAKELLKPEDSVLVVTIDENEHARLTLLLEQIFPEWSLTPVTIVHNPRGVQGDNFSYVHETALFLTPARRKVLGRRSLAPEEVEAQASNLRNWGGESRREDAANCFYPIFVRDQKIVGFGKAVDRDMSVHPPHNESLKDGVVAVWPVDGEGVERKWRYARSTVEGIVDQLQVKKISRGTLAGDLEIQIAKLTGPYKTVWTDSRFDASSHGTQLVRALTGKNFPFPKSLYAVEECIRAAVGHKPEAVVLDFFAGSGTTAHAVMRLNRQDSGKRNSISVTNNEVAPDEQRSLRANKLRPGDPKWEMHGICESITKPRILAALTGATPGGAPLKGEYKFVDRFPLAEGFEENVEFFSLTYEAPLRVASHRDFAQIAPLLWIRAGSRGRRIEDLSSGWDVAETYGVLADLDHTGDFLRAIANMDTVTIAYVVTDEDRLFEAVSQELPDHVEPVRLYEAYLRNFEIESGRGAR